MVGGRGAPGPKGVGSVQKKGPCVGGPVWPSVKMGWREREKKDHFLCFSSLSPPLVPLSE